MMTLKKTHGLIAAPYTGFNGNGEIELKNVPRYAVHLREMGVKGAFVAGTTGEVMFLGDGERLKLLEAWTGHKREGFRIIAHVGSTSLMNAVAMAKESAKLGVEAIAVMGPPFMGPNRIEELVEFCLLVASSAPELPFYYYHMPVLSGVDLSMDEFINKAKLKIPNLAGIKFTDNNLMDMSNCLSLDKRNGGRIVGNC